MKLQLEQLAKESQKNVALILKSHSENFKSFWINNKIFVEKASQELIQLISDDPNVGEIREEKIFHRVETEYDQIPDSTQQQELSWGIEKIEADRAWELGGNTGEGIVVASIDSGVRRTHEALRDNYRTPYGWYDPYARTPNPIHLDTKGTHFLGSIVGSNGVGVAPGAQWVMCRGCSQSECRESSLISCGEWVVCPTLWTGNQPDCSKAPNIVSGSWTAVYTHEKNDSFYAAVVNTWHAANIVPIFGVGIWGMCDTIGSPGDYENVIAVGETMQPDVIAYISSRGPTIDNRIKPDLTAPGLNVRSTCPDNDTHYCLYSGNGGSHVAGTVALLLAKNKSLTFDEIKNLLQDNADRDLGYADYCGGTNYNDWPNNIYGYGRINARRALTALIAG